MADEKTDLKSQNLDKEMESKIGQAEKKNCFGNKWILITGFFLFLVLIFSIFWFTRKFSPCGGFMGSGCAPGFICRYRSRDIGKCTPFFLR